MRARTTQPVMGSVNMTETSTGDNAQVLNGEVVVPTAGSVLINVTVVNQPAGIKTV